MKTDVENNEWKVEAPYLASLQRQNPFLVPEHYFNALPDTINNSVYTEKLKETIASSGFTVPDQYFTTLQTRLLIEADAAPLQNLTKENGFSTPDLYFQKLQAAILSQTTEAIPVKTESKIVRLWHSDLIKYASAACFILVSAFGLYLNQQNFTQETKIAEIANEQMLYDIDEQDIIDHIERSTPEGQKNAETHEEMENYILNNFSQNDLSSALN